MSRFILSVSALNCDTDLDRHRADPLPAAQSSKIHGPDIRHVVAVVRSFTY